MKLFKVSPTVEPDIDVETCNFPSSPNPLSANGTAVQAYFVPFSVTSILIPVNRIKKYRDVLGTNSGLGRSSLSL